MISDLKADGNMFTDPDGVSWDSIESYVECSLLGLCGCGNPGELRDYIRAFMHRLADKDWPPYEDMPAMFLINWLNDRDYAEHGTTVRCSWLTDKGKRLLSDLDTIAGAVQPRGSENTP